MTFADAAPGRIGEIGILDRVNIFDLVEDRIVRDQILDRRSAKVVRVEVAVKFVELEGGCRGLCQQARDEPHPRQRASVLNRSVISDAAMPPTKTRSARPPTSFSA